MYADFQKTVKTFYKKHGRTLPWRPKAGMLTPQWQYRILVSEIMLQQTQVDRVIPLYKKWISVFPTFKSLADASQKDVLLLWQGLGYNRRALNLKRCAETVVSEYKRRLPESYEELQKLPGIGPYTAGALMAFVFNSPIPIIETNIRTVYFHHFFQKKKAVTDTELLKKVERTMDGTNPRAWYYALMDYGSHLKRLGLGNNKKSKHYTKQSTFKGSNRELRAQILREVLHNHPITITALTKKLNRPKDLITKLSNDLAKESMVTKKGSVLDVI